MNVLSSEDQFLTSFGRQASVGLLHSSHSVLQVWGCEQPARACDGALTQGLAILGIYSRERKEVRGYFRKDHSANAAWRQSDVSF